MRPAPRPSATIAIALAFALAAGATHAAVVQRVEIVGLDEAMTQNVRLSLSLVEAIGSTPQSMGVLGWGLHQSAGGTCTGRDVNRPFTGFVVDYRGRTPVIYTINDTDAGPAEVRATCTMSVSAPLHIIYSGERGTVAFTVPHFGRYLRSQPSEG